jgi:hypothetical protein
MGRIDTTFAPIAPALLADWGQTITFIKTTTPRTYNPTTGTVTGADTNVTAKALISPISSRESEGLYQSTDIKVIMSASELGTYYPTEADRIRYTQDGSTREAKIVNIVSYRGDNPVLHTIIARPQ